MLPVDTDTHRLILQLAATYVLFAVFALSAVAFVGNMFGLLRPDVATRRYLFALFGASVVGIFGLAAAGFLQVDPTQVAERISVSAERQASIEQADAPPLNDQTRNLTVFTQIASSTDRPTFNRLQNLLRSKGYIVPGVEVMGRAISKNEIRYCYAEAAAEAQTLASLLQANGFGRFQAVQIGSCPANTRQNVLEVWLKSGS